MKKVDKYGFTEVPELLDLVYQMLNTNPKERISPA
jgi:hypothetical protein